MTAVLDEPFELFERLALVVRLVPLPLRLRDDAEEEPRFDAVVFGLLRELLPLRDDALALLLRDALAFLPRDAPLLFGLDPFELRLFELFLFVPERALLWAIAPP
jgi:hypothetical protein